MFILDLESISSFDLTQAVKFVEFWNAFYKDDVTIAQTRERIDYYAELNVGHLLTLENVRRLLRWKDPVRLTDVRLNGAKPGSANPVVSQLLDGLKNMNDFREGKCQAREFRQFLDTVWKSGIVFPVFVCHICRPVEYPIVDQYALNAFHVHTDSPMKHTWATYDSYVAYFNRIASACGVNQSKSPLERVRELKRVDNALWAFGKFLADYAKNRREGRKASA